MSGTGLSVNHKHNIGHGINQLRSSDSDVRYLIFCVPWYGKIEG